MAARRTSYNGVKPRRFRSGEGAAHVPEPAPIRIGPSSRRPMIIVLAVLVFILLFAVVSETAFDLNFLRPDNNQETLTLAALSALILMLLAALTFVLFRNLLKLWAERQLGVLGSKFRTRMVLGGLLLASVPVMVMYTFAYGLLNRSIDKWFSTPVEQVKNDIASLTTLLDGYAQQNAQAEAEVIAGSPATQRAFEVRDFSDVLTEFHAHQPTLQGGFAVALQEGQLRASFHLPADWSQLQPGLAVITKSAASPGRFSFNHLDYTLASAPVGKQGSVLVAIPLPAGFAQTTQQIRESQQRYFDLAKQRKRVRRFYMGWLLVLTLMVWFVTTWLAMFLSKLVTRPVAALAAATQEISQGRLDYRVDVSAADEIGDLVQSFNRMAEQLESGRRELSAANAELEQRRRQIETILESIPTGVLSLDESRRIVHANQALLRMFRPEQTLQPEVLRGAPLEDVFEPDTLADLDPLLRRAERMGVTTSQLEAPVAGGSLNVAVTVASLTRSGGRAGFVVVFEDLSDLLKAQKQAAWREVAQRVAHEIKNPLTPIALSAERIRRHLDRPMPPDAASLEIIHSCSDVIATSVETVRRLVDEFSTLARFPASRPQPAEINEIVQGALSQFEGRLEGITLSKSLGDGLPPVMGDRESLRRAVANLVDNAAEAMHGALVREIHVATALVPSRDAVEITVADTGHGVTRDLKEKLFLPYFSTRKRGTGLGLAIVSRVIEEHHGSIRVEENRPVGARFIIELPIVTEPVMAVTGSAHG